jgi:lipopolysaccharide transport system permease protein
MVKSAQIGLWQATSEFRLWSHLASRDLRVRYSRTRLGPWWSSLALGALIFGISVAAALIAQDPIREYLPRIAVSLFVWTFISNTFLESIELFSVERGLLLNTRIHELSLVLRVVWRQVLISLYNLPVVIICIVIGGRPLSPKLLLLPITIILTGVGLILPSFIIGLVTLLRRDFAQLIPSAVQLLFFVSPVMWETPESGRLSTIADINPVAWALQAVRVLVLGDTPFAIDAWRWLAAIVALTALAFILSPLTRQIRVRI